MLALETTHAWTAGTLTITIAGVTHVYTLAGFDAYTEMQAFKAWLAASFAGKSVAWTWAHNTDGGAQLTMTFSANTTVNPNATAEALLGFPFVTAATHVGATSAVGTWAPTLQIALSRHTRLLGVGDSGGSCATRPGASGLASVRPKCEAIGTAIDAARVAAILATAATPRRCWIYQLHRDTWRNLALGAVGRSPQGFTAYSFVIDVAGEIL